MREHQRRNAGGVAYSNPPSVPLSLTLYIRANAALFWRWFLYWRKRYMWLRLAILLVVFAPTLYQVRRPLIRELVVYAVTAIDSACSPTSFWKANLLRMRETKSLQKSLLARFDANHDGRLEPAEGDRLRTATGLTPKELSSQTLKADYDRLLAGTKMAGIATRFTTSREMRRWAYQTAQAQETQWHDEQWREVERELRMPYPRAADYLHWSTWRRGINWFRAGLGEKVDRLAPGMFSGVSFPAGMRDQFPAWQVRPYPLWRGLLGWVSLVLIAVVCVRRFVRGEELRRRFREDRAFAEAPCPICGRPTDDFGALREFRPARAIGVGAVVGLAAFAVTAVHPREAHVLLFGVPGGPFLLGIPFAIMRYILWPWEVHACHRRPRLHVIAFVASVIAVVAPLAAIAALWLRVSAWPMPG